MLSGFIMSSLGIAIAPRIGLFRKLCFVILTIPIMATVFVIMFLIVVACLGIRAP